MESEDAQEYIDLVVGLFSPILTAIEDPDEAARLLVDLGYIPPSAVEAFNTFSPTVEKLQDLIDSLDKAIQNQDKDGLLQVLLEVLAVIGELFRGINAFSAAIQNDFAGSGLLTDTDILATIVRKLADYLIVRFLEDYYKTVYAALLLVGIIDIEEIQDMPTQFHAPYLKRTVNWEKIPAFFSDPINTFKSNLMDMTGLRYKRLLYFLYMLGIGVDRYTEFVLPDTSILTTFNNGTDLSPLIHPDQVTAINDVDDLTPLSDINPLSALRFPLLSDPAGTLGLVLYPVMDLTTQKYTGLGVGVGFGGQLQIPLSDVYEMVIKFSANLNDSLGFRWDTSGKFTFINKIFTPNPEGLLEAIQFGVNISINPTGAGEPEKLFVIGVPPGSRFEIGSGRLTLGFEKLDSFRMFVEADLKDGQIILAADGADGFLSTLLPADGIKANFNLGIGVSNKGGLYFKGSSELYIRLPIHLSLGPINIESLGISFGFEKDRLPLTVTSSFSALFGPLAAAVEDIGVRAEFTIKSDRSGNLGPLDVSFGFQPPKGVGLAIDAGVVKGGGYLYLDFDKGEYAGALELSISNWLSLKAIGLINTKMPGGQPGFSLLVIITAEFNPGFQLGYGFVLIGVGGLLGLNRTMLLDPLVQGVRTGAVNSIVFPTNIVANAPKILSDLRTIFPPQEGVFLIGPMAKIGWTTLISLSLGVIIEIPGNVVILGRLGATLPDADDPVLILQVSFVGALEFDKRRIWFFATLFDSHILFITLDGEMGLLMDFSDHPNFVLSVGGFHPRFTAPPLPFPSPARIALSILNESWGRLRAETYFAITSNSVQMGCRVDAFFGYSAFSIEGFFSFDALLRFSPLYLIVEISTGFSLKVFGVGVFSVHLRGSLEGPTPWRIRGSAEISFLFFSFSADVDRTFGEQRTDILPPIEVLPKIRAEFEKLESWRATLPASGQLFVSLRDLGSAGILVLHPVGTLQISQRFAPLNLPLDKIGNQKPSDIKQVTVTVTTSSLAVKGPTKEMFAAAQYREMDDAAKVSAPAYETLDSGIELGASGQPWATGPLAQRNVRYEMIVLDTAYKRLRSRFFKFWDGLFVHFQAGAAVSRTAASAFNEKRMQPFADKVSVADDKYAVAFQKDNRAYQDTATFSSYAQAQAHMAEAFASDPTLTEQLHVIPVAEMNTA